MERDNGPDDRGRPSAVEIDIDAIEPDPDQPRRHFDERSLDLLARALAAHGLAGPIVVRPSATAGRYLLVVDLVEEGVRWFGCGVEAEVEVR